MRLPAPLADRGRRRIVRAVGENGEVLAIASDQAGTRTGLVSDPAHVLPLQDQGYDDALGYIDSKMRFE